MAGIAIMLVTDLVALSVFAMMIATYLLVNALDKLITRLENKKSKQDSDLTDNK